MPPLPDALVRRAGRALPPGLPSARAAERERLLAVALGELGAGLAPDDPRRQGWLARLGEILADLEALRADEELWYAAAGVARALRLEPLTEVLAEALRPGVAARRRAAAQLTLHALHGVWFSGADEVHDFAGQLAAGVVPEPLLARGRELDEENRRHLTRLLRYEPELALASLAHPDPRVRAAAARELGRVGDGAGSVSGGVGRTARVEALFTRLAVEPWPAVLHDLLQAVDRLLAAEWSADAPVAELERRLAEALESLAETAAPGTELSVAQALARLSWDGLDVEGGASHGLGLVARLLRDLVGRPAGADADVLIGVLDSLQLLYHSARAQSNGTGPVWENSSRAARLPVLTLLQDARRDAGVRLAAARAAATLAVRHDVPTLLDVMEQEGTSTELEFVLLSALRGLAPQMAAESEVAERLVDALFDRVAAGDADVRRRAVAFLAEPAMRPLLAGRDRAALVARLAAEPIRELQVSLLQILREVGTPAELDLLLALPELDQLVTEPAFTSGLAATLGTLSAGDPERTFRAAERLAGAAEEDPGLSRTLLALELCGGLVPEAAAALPAEAHARLVEWAMAARSAGVPLPKELSPAFVERLVAVHLPAAHAGTAAGAPLHPARFHHRSALFLADLRGPEAVRDAEVERHFAAALSAPAPEGDPLFQSRVRRDRARFNEARGRGETALSEYRLLLRWERDHDGTGAELPVTRVLDLSDLRAAARLATAARPPAGDALDLAAVLVHQPGWRNEPSAVRLQDLADLVARAELTAERPSLQRVAQWLAAGADAGAGADAPAGGSNGDAADPNAAGEPEGSRAAGGPAPHETLCAGLEVSPGAAERLAALRSRVAAALAALPPEGEVAADPAAGPRAPTGPTGPTGASHRPAPGDATPIEAGPVDSRGPSDDAPENLPQGG